MHCSWNALEARNRINIINIILKCVYHFMRYAYNCTADDILSVGFDAV
jgi:hypothetical protein